MKFILDFLFRLTHPDYWFMHGSYNARLDEWLLKSMQSHNFIEIGQYTVKLNEKTFWVGNRPYAVGLNNTNIRPSARTIAKMLNNIDNESFEG